MPVTLTPAVDLANVKMKFGEQYVSEGLNRKVIPAMPPGIYRGLQMVQNLGAPRQVDVVADPVTGEHEAIYQTSDGFSLTYRDPTTGTILFDLSDASLDSTTVVVTLLMDYIVSGATTAEFRAYTLAEYDALGAGARDELVVLGTINMPAASTNITAAMILPERRTLPWAKKAQGAVEWVPIVRNGGFELSEPNRTEKFAQPFWEAAVAVGNFTWSAKTLAANAGLHVLAIEKTGAGGPITGTLTQMLSVPYYSGQFARIQFFKKNLQVPTAGTASLNIEVIDQDGIPVATTVIPIDTSGVDGSFTKVDTTVTLPIDGAVVGNIEINLSGLDGLSVGNALLLNDIQVHVERRSTLDGIVSDERRTTYVSAHPLVLGETATDEWGDRSTALLRYDVGLPSGGQGGAVRIERVDQNDSLLPPSLSMLGRFLNVGDNLIDSVANALKSRMSGLVRGTAAELTLIQEWGPVSLIDGLMRFYVEANGAFHITVNARWDGTLWNKDVAGKQASRLKMDINAPYWYERSSDTAWADAAWTDGITTGAASLLTQATADARYSYGNFLFSTSTNLSTTGGVDRFLNIGGHLGTAATTDVRKINIAAPMTISYAGVMVNGSLAVGPGYLVQIRKDGTAVDTVFLPAATISVESTLATVFTTGQSLSLSMQSNGASTTAPTEVVVNLSYTTT